MKITDPIDTKEAAAIIGCSIPTVTRLAIAGDLKAEKWGRDWRISRKSAEFAALNPKPTGPRRGRKSLQNY